MSENKITSYKDSGVNIEAGDEFVDRIKKKVKATYNSNVHAGVGGFASLYAMGDKFLACGVDGVGTKLKIATDLKIYNTIGQDLVAMCANDILCTGARPMFFMDYFATGKLDVAVSEQVIDGICKACIDNELALVGGETAEMPGMYQDGDFDLAGFACGEVSKEELLDGTEVKAQDTILGLKSSGFHSNGYSLLRKIVTDKDILNELLTPTKLYWPLLKDILLNNSKTKLVKGLAHITGGGIQNIGRINDSLFYSIDKFPSLNEVDPIFKKVLANANIEKNEMFRTFNMGIGMVLITDQPDNLIAALEAKDEKVFKLGKVQEMPKDCLVNVQIRE